MLMPKWFCGEIAREKLKLTVPLFPSSFFFKLRSKCSSRTMVNLQMILSVNFSKAVNNRSSVFAVACDLLKARRWKSP